jgi:hypothetical protein
MRRMDSLDRSRLKKSVEDLDSKLRMSTNDEMEKLRDEIVVEIRKESFKKEILSDLEADARNSFWKAAQHPAILLVLGFALTTGLGSFLTYKWQSRANEKQAERQTQQQKYDQDQSTRQRTIQQKYELTDEVVRAVAETNTAAEDILVAFQWNPKDRRAFPERTKYWQEASRKWRVESKILIQKLVFRFTDQKIGSSFQAIVEKRKDVGVTIEYIQDLIGEKGWKGMQNDSNAAQETKRCRKLINEIRDELGVLMREMIADIKIDEASAGPPH